MISVIRSVPYALASCDVLCHVLHENPDFGFDMLQFRPPIQLGREPDTKGIENKLQVRVISVHKTIQIARKAVNLPFIQCSLDPVRMEAAAPIGIRG